MNLCDEGHEPIMHENRTCPLCVAEGQIIELQDGVEKLKEQLNEKE